MRMEERTLEVDEDTVPTAPRLALAHNDGGHDLLTELGLTLLDWKMLELGKASK